MFKLIKVQHTVIQMLLADGIKLSQEAAEGGFRVAQVNDASLFVLHLFCAE